MKTTVLVENYLKTLKLPTFLREYTRVARECAKKEGVYEEFLLCLAELEVQERERKSAARRLREADFPVDKDLSTFEFSAVPKLNKKRVLELAQGDYLDKRENLPATSSRACCRHRRTGCRGSRSRPATWLAQSSAGTSTTTTTRARAVSRSSSPTSRATAPRRP